ncbi:MAG: VTT domain-containing protein [Proteobacteria bacterium]|nr:VTT domain-containing protein [Pseudomonadota bacterium]MBU1736918.1 VTT domain-containing protein [Pseudomonadota bacterium]
MRNKNYPLIKAILLILFLLSSLLIFRLTPVGQYIEPQALRNFVAANSFASPIIFILIYGFGISMFLPASFFTAMGAMLFGLSGGIICNFAGAMLGASMSFWIGRYLGRDFAASVADDRLKMYDGKITENGFTTTLYLRLIFFPFTPLNFSMGLTGVTFSQFFWGTFFGKIGSGIILTFFFVALTEVWLSGRWETLLSWQNLLAVFLFAASFFIPKAARHLNPAGLQPATRSPSPGPNVFR